MSMVHASSTVTPRCTAGCWHLRRETLLWPLAQVVAVTLASEPRCPILAWVAVTLRAAAACCLSGLKVSTPVSC